MRLLYIFLLCVTSMASGQNFESRNTTSNTPSLIIYGSDTCHYCLETKAYLKDHNIVFVYFDIDKDEIRLQEMLYKMKENGLSTTNVFLPVVDHTGKVFMNNQDFDTFITLLIQKK